MTYPEWLLTGQVTHTHTHPHTHTHMHTNTHTHTHIYTYTHMHTNTHTHKLTPHKHSYTYTHIHTHAHIQYNLLKDIVENPVVYPADYRREDRSGCEVKQATHQRLYIGVTVVHVGVDTRG